MAITILIKQYYVDHGLGKTPYLKIFTGVLCTVGATLVA
jgi:hypothetical protein